MLLQNFVKQLPPQHVLGFRVRSYQDIIQALPSCGNMTCLAAKLTVALAVMSDKSFQHNNKATGDVTVVYLKLYTHMIQLVPISCDTIIIFLTNI